MTQVGNTIYLIGDGTHSGGTISGRVHAFDLTTGTWSEKAQLNIPRSLPGVVVVGNSIYALGGTNSRLGETARKAVERYDIAANTWTVLPGMDSAEYDGYSANAYTACMEKIYSISTLRTSLNFTLFESADGVNWAAYHTEIPSGHEPTLVASENRIYILGRDQNETANYLIEFDPATKTFTQKAAPLYSERGYTNRCFYFNGKLFKFNSLSASPTVVEVYSIAEDRWTTILSPYDFTDNRIYQTFFTDRAKGEVYMTSLPDVRKGFYFNATNGRFYTR
jgi:hypothetical protein